MILCFAFFIFVGIVFFIIYQHRKSSFLKKEYEYKQFIKDDIILELTNLKSTQYHSKGGGSAKTDLYLTHDSLCIIVRQNFIKSYPMASPRILTRKQLNKKTVSITMLKMDSYGDSILLKFVDNFYIVELRIWGVSEKQKEMIKSSLNGNVQLDGLFMY